MAPIFEDGNNKKDRPREGDLFETRSQAHSLLRARRDTYQYTLALGESKSRAARSGKVVRRG